MNIFNGYVVGQHEIEFRYSPTSTFSPWHLDVLKEKNIPAMMTSDVAYFVRIDRKEIYRAESRNTYLFVMDYIKKLETAYSESTEAGEACLSEFISKLVPYGTVEEFLEKLKK